MTAARSAIDFPEAHTAPPHHTTGANGATFATERTAHQEHAFQALHGDGGFSSWERVLRATQAHNRKEILSNACVELYRLASKANVSHVQIADWATEQGQKFSIGDDDQVQKIISDAKRTAERPDRPKAAATKINAAANYERSLIIQCANDIEAQPITWLWQGRIARGKHTCIAGEPGTGESQLSIAIIAAVTVGGDWPCSEGKAPLGNAIILSAEDGMADTVIPRLQAAGYTAVRPLPPFRACRRGMFGQPAGTVDADKRARGRARDQACRAPAGGN